MARVADLPVGAERQADKRKWVGRPDWQRQRASAGGSRSLEHGFLRPKRTRPAQPRWPACATSCVL